MVIPKVLRPAWNAWMTVGHAIGVVMSSILLTILWVFLFGAYAISLKFIALFARHKKRDSYWWDVTEEPTDFTHQF